MAIPITPSELRAALSAGEHEAVLAAFGELEFLDACCRPSVVTLIGELAYAVRDAPAPLPAGAHLDHPSGARIDAEVLTLVAAILEANRQALTRAPDRLFSILYGELSWRDVDSPHHPGGRKLWLWAEYLRATFEARPAACWLRPLRPPETLTLVAFRVPGEARSLSADGRVLLLSREIPGSVSGKSGRPPVPPVAAAAQPSDSGGAHVVVRSRGAARLFVLLDARTGRALVTIETSTGVSLAPDSACFAIFADKNMELWSRERLAPYATLTPHERDVQRAVFSADSRVVFTEAFTAVRAYRVADGACLASRTIDCESYIGGLLPCGEGSVLVHDGKRWLLWQYLEDRLRPIGDAEYVTAQWSVVSPSGDRLIIADGGKYTISGWRLPEGQLQFREQFRGDVTSLAFHPSGAFFSGGQGFYDASTGKEIARLPSTLVSKGTWPAFDPTGRFLVTRHDVPEAAQVWDVQDLTAPTLLGRVPIGRHTRGQPRARFSGDGRTLVFSDWNETVVVDLAALPGVRKQEDVPPVHMEWRTRFSPAGTTVVFVHERGLSFWDVARGALRRFVAAKGSLGFFAGGSRVLAREGDALCALDAEDGAEVWRLTQPGEWPEEAHAADQHGVLLYSGHRIDGVVLGLDMRDGHVRYRLSGMMVLLFDRDLFLTRNAQGEVALREVATGVVRLTLPGLVGGHFAISPDHRWLAAHEHTTELWDLTTGTRAQVLESSAYSFRFREDSAALIATSSQSPQSGNTDTITEEIFDVTTGARIGGTSWDESGSGDNSAPQEIAPGIVKDGSTLRVGESALALPDNAVVCHTPRGETFVAGLSAGKRVELYVLSAGVGA